MPCIYYLAISYIQDLNINCVVVGTIKIMFRDLTISLASQFQLHTLPLRDQITSALTDGSGTNCGVGGRGIQKTCICFSTCTYAAYNTLMTLPIKSLAMLICASGPPSINV